jgi:hypothetical protein
MTANNRLVLLTALLVAAVLATPFRAGATLVRSVSFDDKVGNAEAILLGRCTATRTGWDPEHRWILTYATFAVEESMKGAPIREVTVAIPGGSIDGVHQSSVGITPFEKGDERVLFVKNTRVGPTVLYFDQGAYSIAKSDKGERLIIPAVSESVRVDSQRGMAVPVEEPRTLRQFVTAVRESERRIDAVKMQMLERQRLQQQQQQSSLGSLARRYWFLIALAGIGAALATWQLVRK